MKKLLFFILLAASYSCWTMEETSSQEGSSSARQLRPAVPGLISAEFELLDGTPKTVVLSQAVVKASTTLTNLLQSTNEPGKPIPILKKYSQKTIEQFEQLSKTIISLQNKSEQLDAALDAQIQIFSTENIMHLFDLASYLDIQLLLNSLIKQIKNKADDPTFLTTLKTQNKDTLIDLLQYIPYCSYIHELWLAKAHLSFKKITAHDGHITPQHTVSWSPDNKYIATNSTISRYMATTINGTVKLISIETNDIQILTGPKITPHVVVFNSDGTRLAASRGFDATKVDKGIYIWDTAKISNSPYIIEKDQHIYSFAWHPTNPSICAYSVKEKTVLWDIDQQKTISEFTPDFPSKIPLSLAWKNDGTELAAGYNNDGRILIWDLAKGYVTSSMPFQDNSPVTALAFNPKNNCLASAKTSDKITIWCNKKQSYSFKGKATSLSWDPSGTYLAFISTQGPAICNPQTQKIIRVLNMPDTAYVAWSPDGNFLAAGGFDEIGIWSVKNDQLEQECLLLENPKDNLDAIIAIMSYYHAWNKGKNFNWYDFPELLHAAHTLPVTIQKLIDVYNRPETNSYWRSLLFRVKSWISEKQKVILGTGVAAAGLVGVGAYLYLKKKRLKK